ncbi:hypothetical protein ACLI09_05100 [Flavobacterium sp. RHBU_24]|uniref:hypothetical protein n=1 Tax=Flavobacterium sp. RHBU_24 TaxID=3391185 RepID=UPI003984F4AA
MKLKLLSLLLVMAMLSGCSVDSTPSSCYNQLAMTTTQVTGPATVVVNTQATFNVSFYVANACGEFNNFQQTPDFPKSVVAFVDYDGCNCEQIGWYDTQPFTFTPTTVGTYEFRFLTDNPDTPIVKTLVVTAE